MRKVLKIARDIIIIILFGAGITAIGLAFN